MFRKHPNAKNKNRGVDQTATHNQGLNHTMDLENHYTPTYDTDQRKTHAAEITPNKPANVNMCSLIKVRLVKQTSDWKLRDCDKATLASN